KVNGRSCTIVGVARAGFTGAFALSESELYLPAAPLEGDENRRVRWLHTLARTRGAVTIDRAQAVLDVISQRLAVEYPAADANITDTVVPEPPARPEEDQSRPNAFGAGVMIAMAIIVMMVAAVNVTNLLLVRATSRYPELAIRAALGAGRGRLARQAVTESL